jgi:hypothetical protein
VQPHCVNPHHLMKLVKHSGFFIRSRIFLNRSMLVTWVQPIHLIKLHEKHHGRDA